MVIWFVIKVQSVTRLNLHFSTVGKKVSDSVTDSNRGKSDPLKLIRRVSNNLLLSLISESYVCKIVRELKAKTSSRYDDISNVLLQRIISVIKLPVVIVFNKSLNEGIFPNLMKLAKIIPLHKGGLKDVPDNYRPISLLPVLSKVLERVVYNALVTHFESNGVIYVKQFGFRKHHSTSDAITCLLGEILQCLHRKSMLISVFIDLKKAFDTVPHSLIISKLEQVGVRGVALQWFESYMSNRRQFVQLGDCVSQPAPVEIGVQQGSLLGVLLFKLLINDLPRCLRFSSSILYADDTTIFVYGNSLRFIRSKLQTDLSHLSMWLALNRLKLNTKKTKVMVFETTGLLPNIYLEIEGEPLENVQTFRFLGLNLCNDLSFGDHYMQTYTKLSQCIFMLRKLLQFLPRSCLRTLYFAYFHSHLSYCLLLWYPLITKSAQLKLYKLQKRAVRILCGAHPLEHCMPLFKEKGILIIDDLLYTENCKLVYRVINSVCSIALTRLINANTTIESEDQCTRSQIRVPRHSSSRLNQSFLCKAVMDWSKLQSRFKDSKHYKVLSKKLKSELLKKY